MGVHVRIDLIEGLDLDVFVRVLMEYSSPRRHLVAKETPPDNPHVHIYLDTAKTVSDVRNFISRRFKELKKADKCVKAWGDGDEDLRYFVKGTGPGSGVNVLYTSFQPMEYMKFNEAFHKFKKSSGKVAKESMTEWLVRLCMEKGVKSPMDIVSVFVDARRGREGICPFKHGPMIRSAYIELNEESVRQSMKESMCQRIFYN